MGGQGIGAILAGLSPRCRLQEEGRELLGMALFSTTLAVVVVREGWRQLSRLWGARGTYSHFGSLSEGRAMCSRRTCWLLANHPPTPLCFLIHPFVNVGTYW